MLRPTAANSSGELYRGVEAADCFMASWHADDGRGARWLRHAAEEAKSGGGGKIYSEKKSSE